MAVYSDRHVRRLAQNAIQEMLLLRENDMPSDQEEQPIFHGVEDQNFVQNGDNHGIHFPENQNEMEIDDEELNIRFEIEDQIDAEEVDIQFDNENEGNSSASYDSVNENYLSTDEADLSDGGDHDEILDIKAELRAWAIDLNVQNNHVTALLKILQKYHKGLPGDVRSLKSTPRTTEVKDVSPGSYVHFGLQKNVVKVIKEFSLTQKVTVDINADGIPASKSGNKELWVLQGFVKEAPKSKPFIIGIWEGRSKPKDFNDFLEDFVNEAEDLEQTGLVVDNSVVLFEIGVYRCDAPARASLTKIKGHNSKIGCGQCTQRGRKILGRVAFTTSTAEARKDEDFLDPDENPHIHGQSILTRLKPGLVTAMPYDYQHLVCLGVMRKKLDIWMGNKKYNKRGRIRKSERDQISIRLLSLIRYVPLEFQRKPRCLKELDRWKATEFRQFVLYTGPLVLKSILKDDHYKHFLLLHVAILILSTKSLYQRYNDYASYLLSNYVQDFSKLYGRDMVSYNIHGLLHLAQHSKAFGTLDDFSTFPFENNLGKMKRLLHSKTNTLIQISNRIQEQNGLGPIKKHSNTNFPISRVPHKNGPTLDIEHSQQFKILDCENFSIRLTKADNIFSLSTGDIIQIKNILCVQGNQYKIIGEKLRKIGDFYTSPCNSSEFGIWRVKKDARRCHSWPVEMIEYKCVGLPYKDGLTIFPLIHCK